MTLIRETTNSTHRAPREVYTREKFSKKILRVVDETLKEG